jgi:hypothetical protein
MMNLQFCRLLSLIFCIVLILVPVATQAQDVCSLDGALNLLEDAKVAQQDSDTEKASADIGKAISELNAIMKNCSIKPLEEETLGDIEDNVPISDDPMFQPKDNGFYLVGIDIAPGRWESDGIDDGCYWEVSTRDGYIVKNHFGYAGGTVTITESDFQVEFSDCGAFIYVDNLERSQATDANSPKKDGFYTVGVEIATGLWRSTGDGDSCYYEKLDDQQDIIDNHFGNSGVTIDVLPSDYEIHFNDCGIWEYLGE